jgi:hypothetical protein
VKGDLLMPVTVFIGTPGDQAVIPEGSFEASGNVNPPGARISAQVRAAAAQQIAGESLPPRPGYDWTFRFPGVATNEPVTLTVRAFDPVTQETGEASHTIHCMQSGAAANPNQEAHAPFHAADVPPLPAGDLFSSAPGHERQTTAEQAALEVVEDVEAPASLPPVTAEPALAATGELPAEATVPEGAPRRRPRPAARKKPAARAGKGARVPAGRRAKASPAKAARTPAARRSRGPAKKAASAMTRKAAKKSASKTGKAAAKKSAKATPKKNVKAKTAKVAASGARRGTKPTAKKASRAVAKTNPKKRHSR